MKKTLLLMLFISLIDISNSFSQSRYIGIKFGINQTNINLKQYNEKVYPYSQAIKSAMGQFLGVTYYFSNKNQYFIGIELNYSKRCFNNTIRLLDSIRNPIKYDLNDHLIKTIELPLLAGKNFGNKLFAGFNVGLIPLYIFEIEVYDKSSRPHQILDGTNALNCDWEGTFLLGLKIRSNIIIQTEIRYQQSLLDLYKKQQISSNFFGKLQTLNFGLKVNYKIQ